MMLMGRLSQTDPMKAFQFNEEGGLHSGDISNAWAATHAIFGATWKDRTRWNEGKETKDADRPMKKKEVSISPVSEVKMVGQATAVKTETEVMTIQIEFLFFNHFDKIF